MRRVEKRREDDPEHIWSWVRLCEESEDEVGDGHGDRDGNADFAFQKRLGRSGKYIAIDE